MVDAKMDVLYLKELLIIIFFKLQDQYLSVEDKEPRKIVRINSKYFSKIVKLF